MSYVTTTVDERGVATLVIDHPPINLMTLDVFVELLTTGTALAADADVRAVVLRSASADWFIAHFDIEAILAMSPAETPPTELHAFHQMCESFRTMPKPTIAVIEGRVGGGGSELATSCDMRFATPGAVLSQPEVALGIIPGGSGTVRLPRLVGRGPAMEIILGCDDVDASTAERWGWVNRVLPADEIGAFVDRLCGRIASFPAHAVAAAKASVLRAEAGIEEHLLAEAAAFDTTLGSDETQAAMRTFLERGGQTSDVERGLGEFAGRFRDS
ncbi:MAG: enoyl-CoA hydratase/isomerase family protein [Ilumatobacteraceae bacterium]